MIDIWTTVAASANKKPACFFCFENQTFFWLIVGLSIFLLLVLLLLISLSVYCCIRRRSRALKKKKGSSKRSKKSKKKSAKGAKGVVVVPSKRDATSSSKRRNAMSGSTTEQKNEVRPSAENATSDQASEKIVREKKPAVATSQQDNSTASNRAHESEPPHSSPKPSAEPLNSPNLASAMLPTKKKPVDAPPNDLLSLKTPFSEQSKKERALRTQKSDTAPKTAIGSVNPTQDDESFDDSHSTDCSCSEILIEAKSQRPTILIPSMFNLLMFLNIDRFCTLQQVN